MTAYLSRFHQWAPISSIAGSSCGGRGRPLLHWFILAFLAQAFFLEHTYAFERIVQTAMAMRILVLNLLASPAVYATNVGGSAGDQPSALKLVMSNESSTVPRCACLTPGWPCPVGFLCGSCTACYCTDSNCLPHNQHTCYWPVPPPPPPPAPRCSSDSHGNRGCQSGCSNSAGGICCNYGRPGCHATSGCQSGYASNYGYDVCCSKNAKGEGESGTKEAKTQVVKDDVGGSAGEQPSALKLVTNNESSNAFTCRWDCHGNRGCQSGCSNSAGGICCNNGRSGCHATSGCQSGYASNYGHDVCCSNNAKGEGESGTKEAKTQVVKDDVGGSAGEQPSALKPVTNNESSNTFCACLTPGWPCPDGFWCGSCTQCHCTDSNCLPHNQHTCYLKPYRTSTANDSAMLVGVSEASQQIISV
jgi:hypothetical protein